MNSKSQKLFKTSLLVAGILLIGGVIHAQSNDADTTHRNGMHHHWGGSDSLAGKNGFHRGGPGAFRPGGAGAFRSGGHADGRQAFGGRNHRGFGHGPHGNGIRYTPEQRRQVMAINKEYHEKAADLFKKDNSTLKEYKAGLVALQKEKKSKLEALLTPQQKEQIVRRKKITDENRQVAEAGRMERLKLRLNLSDDQVAKIKAGQTDLRTQFRSIHDNDNLLPQQKMEQMKGLMAKRKDVFKSVLTPEQFSKFEEMSHRRGFGREGHEGPGGRRSTTSI